MRVLMPIMVTMRATMRVTTMLATHLSNLRLVPSVREMTLM